MWHTTSKGYETLSAIFVALPFFGMLAVILFLEDEPPLPPTTTAQAVRARTAPQHIRSPLLSPFTTLYTYWGTALGLFRVRGFGITVLTNTCATAAAYLASQVCAQ